MNINITGEQIDQLNNAIATIKFLGNSLQAWQKGYPVETSDIKQVGRVLFDLSTDLRPLIKVIGKGEDNA